MQEMKNKIKEEQSRVREEVSVIKERKTEKTLGCSFSALIVLFQRHKEYIKMLKEREEALGEF